jgi:hypothetical protein
MLQLTKMYSFSVTVSTTYFLITGLFLGHNICFEDLKTVRKKFRECKGEKTYF